MSTSEPARIKTIGEFHHLAGLPRPEHPPISVINLVDAKHARGKGRSRVNDFYSITIKHCVDHNFRYGQEEYKVQAGIMYFIAPGQVYGPLHTDKEYEAPQTFSGWGLHLHPDFF